MRCDTGMKVCSKCHRDLPLDDFWSDSRATDGKRSACRECFSASVTEWRRNNPDKVRVINSQERRGDETVAEYQRRYKQAHREELNERQREARAAAPRRDRARDAVRRALLRGDLTRSDVCDRCGATGRRIEASHDDYDQPLVVEWLCVRCHRAKDAGGAS